MENDKVKSIKVSLFSTENILKFIVVMVNICVNILKNTELHSTLIG